MKHFRKQKGVAIIVVALSMVAIGGMAQLAIEGGRMIQETNRLADASEAATLAVAIANRYEIEDSNTMARAYIDYYLPNVDLNEVNVVRKEGQQKVGDDTLYYVQYEVDASAQFDAQMNFLGNDGVNITETRSVNNDAMARTYMLPSDLDLVFVADFSGSMGYKWSNSNSKTKLQVLKEQVVSISKDLLDSDANQAGYAHRIGFVPYNMRTRENIDGKLSCVTELEYIKNADMVSYESINWRLWGQKSSYELKKCNSSSVHCPDGTTKDQAKAILDIFSKAKHEINSNSDRYYPDPLSYIDLNATVSNWNVTKTSNSSLHPFASIGGSELFSSNMCGNSKEDFETIPLSLDTPDISGMKAGGYTSVYQGLIRGAQILAEGRLTAEEPDEYHKRAQMLLILSDGEELPFTNTFSSLVDAGLCKKIKEHFNDHDSGLYIGVIGIDFKASAQEAFGLCAGVDAIIDVENSDDLKEKIQELIRKGAATNGVSRLYDKTL